MQRYSLIVTAGGHDYSFGLDTLESVLELLGTSREVTAFTLYEYENGAPKVLAQVAA